MHYVIPTGMDYGLDFWVAATWWVSCTGTVVKMESRRGDGKECEGAMGRR